MAGEPDRTCIGCKVRLDARTAGTQEGRHPAGALQHRDPDVRAARLRAGDGAEIAAAAGVSVKTVFNYFGTKEELFFDRNDELLEGLLAALRDRPPGTSPTQAVRGLLLDGPFPDGACRWSDLPALYEAIRGWVACERASPALSARRLFVAREWVDPLARESGSVAWAAMFLA